MRLLLSICAALVLSGCASSETAAPPPSTPQPSASQPSASQPAAPPPSTPQPSASQSAGHQHGQGPTLSLLDPSGADRVTAGLAVHVDGLRGIDPADPPAGSAVGRAMGYVGDAYTSLVYGRPFKRGRVIFGGLVGYDQIWSTGAHMATEITFTRDVMVGPGMGEHLEAGTYSIQTVPGEETWTVHFNRELGMHLADDYDASQNALSLEVPVEALPEVVEQLTIDFVDAAPEDGLDMRIRWDQTGITIPLRRC
jgi:hypothetical protein